MAKDNFMPIEQENDERAPAQESVPSGPHILMVSAECYPAAKVGGLAGLATVRNVGAEPCTPVERLIRTVRRFFCRKV